MSKLQRQLLEVSLLDLDNGMLTFGGSTGTGHGRVEVMKLNVNGMDYTENLKSGSMGFWRDYMSIEYNNTKDKWIKDSGITPENELINEIKNMPEIIDIFWHIVPIDFMPGELNWSSLTN